MYMYSFLAIFIVYLLAIIASICQFHSLFYPVLHLLQAVRSEHEYMIEPSLKL